MRPNRITCREAIQAANDETSAAVDELESWYDDDDGDVFDHWEERVSFVPPANDEWKLIQNDQLQAPHRCVYCYGGFKQLVDGLCGVCRIEWRPESYAEYLKDVGLYWEGV